MLGVLSSKTSSALYRHTQIKVGGYSPHPNSLSPFQIMAVKWPVKANGSDPFPGAKSQLLISLYHASVTAVPEVKPSPRFSPAGPAGGGMS